MKYIILVLINLILSISYAKDLDSIIKVAVIDTGYSGAFATPKLKKQLCDSGHYDITAGQPILGYDMIGHGTYVANILFETANIDNSCLLVYKIIDPFYPSPEDAIYQALVHAYKAGANVINMSVSINRFSAKERRAIDFLTKKGVKIFVSAGNESTDLNNQCLSYPTCYKGLNLNFHRVGALDQSGLVEAYSNKGFKVDLYEYGTILNVGRGTSFSSPRAAGNYLRETYGKN